MIQLDNFNAKVRELLNFTVLQYMLDTIYENPRLGKIFVDNRDNPGSCIVSFHHLLFCGGKPTQDCLRFLSDHILIDEIPKDYEVLCMIYPDAAWEEALRSYFRTGTGNLKEACIDMV
jgi:hypothetical protein